MNTTQPAAISAAPVTTRNTVKTALSEQGADALSIILHWFWDETDHDQFNLIIMDMLQDYLAHPDKSPFIKRKPDDIARFVSNAIELNKLLCEVMNDEKPWNWIDTCNGWELSAANSNCHE